MLSDNERIKNNESESDSLLEFWNKMDVDLDKLISNKIRKVENNNNQDDIIPTDFEVSGCLLIILMILFLLISFYPTK